MLPKKTGSSFDEKQPHLIVVAFPLTAEAERGMFSSLLSLPLNYLVQIQCLLTHPASTTPHRLLQPSFHAPETLILSTLILSPIPLQIFMECLLLVGHCSKCWDIIVNKRETVLSLRCYTEGPDKIKESNL